MVSLVLVVLASYRVWLYSLQCTVHLPRPRLFICAQMGEIARLLKIPSSRLKIPANSLGSMPNTANTPLRQALDVACRMRSGVERLAGVWREKPGDLELSAVLEVTRQLQRDSYRWVRCVYSVNDVHVSL